MKDKEVKEEPNERLTYHELSNEETLEKLQSNFEDGLTDEEVRKRQEAYGKNELEGAKKKTIFGMIWDQLKDVMILILLIAATVSFVFEGIHTKAPSIEGFVIIAIIIVNTVIGVIQEKRASNAIDSLKNMSAPQARVIRNGEECLIDAKELVPGDIVYLEDGSIVPADIRILEVNNLKISEASLTGESLPVDKEDDVVLKKDTPLGDRVNMAYASSIVMYGNGYGVVTNTGMDTEVGEIADMLRGQKHEDSPLKKKLGKIGKSLSVVGIIVAILIFIVKMSWGSWVFWQNGTFSAVFISALMMAISLAISVIPEGLPATATIVMALGVQRMAKQQALVRKLPAVETLGGASVICTDKTGTLTINKMTVVEIAVNGSFKDGKSIKVEEALELKHLDTYKQLINCCALCNNATRDQDNPNIIYGDPTEGALISLATLFGVDNEEYEEQNERLFEQPFDSDRKMMSTINKMPDGFTVYTKGAVEELLEECTHISTHEGVRKITQKDIDGILRMNLNMSRRALRVLGYAYKKIKVVPEDDEENVETDLIFIGMTGMIDPPRTEVKDAIKTCHDAGIKVIMITGDHRITATTIARQLGILRATNTVLDGDDIDDLSDDELKKALQNCTVFARVSPSDKLRIVEALKANGEVVAMTGDGVNDSPALKSADIGIAMGITGTDVAKDASDMVLMDDNFTTIEYAVREGRRVYRNIQKVIQFLLAGNIAEVITILFAAIFILPEPINAVQILVINLVTDTLPALALGVDPADKDIMKEKPIRTGSMFDKGLVSRVILHGIYIVIATFLAYFIGIMVAWQEMPQGVAFSLPNLMDLLHGTGPLAINEMREIVQPIATTMAFSVLAISQLIHSVNQRSNKLSLFSKGNGKNKSLRYAILASAVIMLIILFVPGLNNKIFGVIGLYGSGPEGKYWWLYLVALLISFLPTVFVEIHKLIIRTLDKRKEQKELEKEIERGMLRDTMKQMVKEAVREANEEARIIEKQRKSLKKGEIIYDENGEPISIS